ncbi:MAG: hypothetical protein K9K75_02065 [Deltaproteobacteria bacterium]|nr:hypothetical protein [Deltaproteobacteria bacterium]
MPVKQGGEKIEFLLAQASVIRHNDDCLLAYIGVINYVSNHLSKFQSYLVSKSFVNEKNAPYYTRWVYSCYAFTNQPLSKVLTQAQKRDFLKHFAKTHEDWQVKQAETALRLYDYYLSLLQMPVDGQFLKDKEKWSVVVTNAKNAMRLKHMSYSTYI